QRKRDLTYMFISHDLRVVAALASRLLVLRHGKMVEEGAAADLFKAPNCDYQRYRLTLTGTDGATHTQTRDILLAGKVVAVLPIDLVRDEIVLIRQFRLTAHLANGRGDMIEAVAGWVEAGESLLEAARRECTEEIAVAPTVLVELFSYLTTPGLTDEEVTVFLAAVDASRVP